MSDLMSCDGSCYGQHKEIRVLPTGGSSNALLCKSCYYKEIAWRRDANLSVCNKWDLPSWESLRIYDPGE